MQNNTTTKQSQASTSYHYNDQPTSDSQDEASLPIPPRVISPRLTLRALIDPIDQDPLSPERIREILDYAGFATDMHEDVIFVLMSHAPVMVTHIMDSQFIDLSTTLPTKPGSRLRPLLKFVNALNNNPSNARFYLKQHTGWAAFYDPRITPWQDEIYAGSSVLAEGGNLHEQLPVSVHAFIKDVDFAAQEGIKAGFVTLPPRPSIGGATMQANS